LFFFRREVDERPKHADSAVAFLERCCCFLSVPAGPGTYTNPYETGKEAPKYSMPGRANAASPTAKSPGPGSYELAGDMSKGRFSASMKSRHFDKPDAFAPGPGAYKLADSIGGPGNSPSYTMRPKPSAKSSSESVPGPGAYSLATSIGTAPSVSMTSRREVKPAVEVPGPGAYKLEGHTGRDGAKYTLRPKTNVPADLAHAPGPGQLPPPRCDSRSTSACGDERPWQRKRVLAHISRDSCVCSSSSPCSSALFCLLPTILLCFFFYFVFLFYFLIF
jgi:hypothetical protein